MLFCDRLPTHFTCTHYVTLRSHINIKKPKELDEELDEVEELVLMATISDYIDCNNWWDDWIDKTMKRIAAITITKASRGTAIMTTKVSRGWWWLTSVDWICIHLKYITRSCGYSTRLRRSGVFRASPNRLQGQAKGLWLAGKELRNGTRGFEELEIWHGAVRNDVAGKDAGGCYFPEGRANRRTLSEIDRTPHPLLGQWNLHFPPVVLDHFRHGNQYLSAYQLNVGAGTVSAFFTLASLQHH